MSIFFYLPSGHLPSPERQAMWMDGRIPDLLGGGKSASAQSWIFQTWAELRGRADVELVSELPGSGMIVTLSNLLPDRFQPGRDQFVVAVAADFLPHPGAHIQVLQNPAHARRLPGSVFMPHWPQPNLIPRDPARGPRMETIAFFGDPSNLARELAAPGFAQQLESEAGVRLDIRDSTRWHDYSDVDAALAVRDFSRARHLSKPATKLYNAWLARVPLIGGLDSAFATDGHPGTDYLIARSPADCLSLVRRLKECPGWSEAIVNAGTIRAASRSREAVRAMWQEFCASELPARWAAWKKTSPLRKAAKHQSLRGLYFLDKKIRS